MFENARLEKCRQCLNLTAWGGDLEKLIVTQIMQKCFAFNEIRCFIITITRARQWCVRCGNQLQSMMSYFLKITFNIPSSTWSPLSGLSCHAFRVTHMPCPHRNIKHTVTLHHAQLGRSQPRGYYSTYMCKFLYGTSKAQSFNKIYVFQQHFFTSFIHSSFSCRNF